MLQQVRHWVISSNCWSKRTKFQLIGESNILFAKFALTWLYAENTIVYYTMYRGKKAFLIFWLFQIIFKPENAEKW